MHVMYILLNGLLSDGTVIYVYSIIWYDKIIQENDDVNLYEQSEIWQNYLNKLTFDCIHRIN